MPRSRHSRAVAQLSAARRVSNSKAKTMLGGYSPSTVAKALATLSAASHSSTPHPPPTPHPPRPPRASTWRGGRVDGAELVRAREAAAGASLARRKAYGERLGRRRVSRVGSESGSEKEKTGVGGLEGMRERLQAGGAEAEATRPEFTSLFLFGRREERASEPVLSDAVFDAHFAAQKAVMAKAKARAARASARTRARHRMYAATRSHKAHTGALLASNPLLRQTLEASTGGVAGRVPDIFLSARAARLRAIRNEFDPTLQDQG